MSLLDDLRQALADHQANRLAEAEARYRGVLAADQAQADAWHLLGVLLNQTGRSVEAVACIRRAIAERPGMANYHSNLAEILRPAGDLAGALAAVDEALRLDPRHADALINRSVILLALDRPAEAITSAQAALAIRPGDALAANNLGNAVRKQGKLADAIGCYRQALAWQPTLFDARYNLATALREQGDSAEAFERLRQLATEFPARADVQYELALMLERDGTPEEALAAADRALELQPDYVDAAVLRGALLQRLGREFEAQAGYEKLLAAHPDCAAAMVNLATSYQRRGDYAQAVELYERALAIQPGLIEGINNFGTAYEEQGRLELAAERYRQALQLRPNSAQVWFNLGRVRFQQARLDNATEAYGRALAIDPAFAEAHCNLGNALADQGRLAEALVHYEQAARLKPASAMFAGNVLFAAAMSPGVSPHQLAELQRQWGLRFPASLREYENPPDRRRSLRIGYVSPDLRRHAVASFFEPILRSHDPAQFTVYVYSDAPRPDATTERLRALAPHWLATPRTTDDELYERIRADRIDILVDLAGHTAGNRLPLFARRPAPVQVTYLGFAESTGLSQIDYWLTDAVADPPDEPSWSSEQLVRLPTVFACFQPPTDAPTVGPLPALAAGHLTFGSFHGLSRLNPAVLDTWAAVLRAVPDSRLVVCRHTLHGRARTRLAAEFAERGIAADRVTLLGTLPAAGHLALYHQIDVSLDSFPWSGHTTACESLWMGVPIVTLRGQRHAGRMVASVLSAVGLSDWIAESRQEYVEIARSWATRSTELAQLRNALRDRVAASPLTDASAFVAALEAAYREMWQAWCSKREPTH